MFAAPYHRNNDGNNAMLRIMMGTADEARTLLHERNADYLAISGGGVRDGELYLTISEEFGADAIASVPRLATLELTGVERNGRVVVRAYFEARADGKPWLDWLTTTTHHDLHHAQAGWNYAPWFTWWARWMGTEHPEYHARYAAIARRPLLSAVGSRPAGVQAP